MYRVRAFSSSRVNRPSSSASLYGGLPGLDQEVHLLFLVQLRLAGRLRQLVRVGVGGGQHEPVPDAFASSAPAFR